MVVTTPETMPQETEEEYVVEFSSQMIRQADVSQALITQIDPYAEERNIIELVQRLDAILPDARRALQRCGWLKSIEPVQRRCPAVVAAGEESRNPSLDQPRDSRRGLASVAGTGFYGSHHWQIPEAVVRSDTGYVESLLADMRLRDPATMLRILQTMVETPAGRQAVLGLDEQGQAVGYDVLFRNSLSEWSESGWGRSRIPVG